jgi:guanylate kinase
MGRSGAGKTTYLHRLKHLLATNNQELNIKELKYHTTREKRSDENDDDYKFSTMDDYNRDKEAGNIIEERLYHKYDGDVIYYTTKEDLEVESGYNLICAASVDQYISYSKLYDTYAIILHTPLKERVTRLIDRSTTDDEILEVCRRELTEHEEYDKLKSFILKENKYHVGIYNSAHDVYSLNDKIELVFKMMKVAYDLYHKNEEDIVVPEN